MARDQLPGPDLAAPGRTVPVPDRDQARATDRDQARATDQDLARATDRDLARAQPAGPVLLAWAPGRPGPPPLLQFPAPHPG